MPDLDAGIGLGTLGQISCSPIFPLLSLVNSEIKQFFSLFKDRKVFPFRTFVYTPIFACPDVWKSLLKCSHFQRFFFFFFLSPSTDIRLLQHRGSVYVSHISKTIIPHKTYERKKTIPFSLHKFHNQNILRKGGMLMMVAGRHF